MTTFGGLKSSVRHLIEMLRAELAWYPGRFALVGRIVLACASVMLLAEIFRIPGAALGASFPILISRETPAASRKSAFQIGLACSIGTAEVIVGGMLTAGSPFLHVMWVGASLFGVFYAISVLNFTSASLTLSALVAVAIQLWDYPIPAEVRVERTLYTLLAILIACVVTVLIEILFAKKNPPDAVVAAISRRMSLVETLLGLAASAEKTPTTLTLQLSRSAARGVDDLWGLLANAGYDVGLHNLFGTVIGFTRQLVELGSNLAEIAPALSVEDRQRCRVIAENLGAVRLTLGNNDLPALNDVSFSGYASNPILMEIERTIDLVVRCSSKENLSLQRSFSSTVRTTSTSGAVTASIQNGEHFTIAVRGTLSALVCYLFYMSTGWMNLGASILTCTLTARRLTGASRQRQSLRFAGFIVGAGVIGLGTEVFILPQIDNLMQYAVLFASVVWIGSWVSTSGPRIAFAGFQIVLAYSLVNLNRFTINTSLVPARDSVLGIVLGVAAMWLVFDHLWAETSSASVRGLFLVTLRNIANFKTVSAESPQEANQRLVTESSRINRDIDKLRDLADMYAFESFPKKPHESLVNRSIRTLLPGLRAFLLVKMGLLQHRNLAVAKVEEGLIQEVEERASSALYGLANAIEEESREQLSSSNVHAEELRAKVSMEEEKSRDGKDQQKHTEIRLCASLLDVASDLERRARLNFALETDTANLDGSWPIGTIAETK
jgi:multidrug resistance protein MdtO